MEETSGFMLISFRAKNYKSFLGEALLDLNANRSDKTNPGAVLNPGDKSDTDAQILACAAIYGANASGKTNLLMALDDIRTAVSYSQSVWKQDWGTFIHQNVSQSNIPTELELVLVIGGVRYRYGFLANETMFLQEWLYSYPFGRERELFNRYTTKVGDQYEVEANFGRSLTGNIREFKSSLRRTKHNSLLISSMYQDNQVEATGISRYLESGNSIISSMNMEDYSNFASGFTYSMEGFRNLLLGMIQTADDNIDDLQIEKAEDGEADNVTERKRSGIPEKYDVYFRSRIGGVNAIMPLQFQSRGVKKIYAMSANICVSLLSGSLLIIDELDSSLHPHLVAKVVSIFQNPTTNPNGAQLIFTTHDTHLIDLEHLRRDQVWFVEKEDGLSELFSLAEFSPRKGEDMEAAYLRGAYGGIPNSGVSLRLLGINEPLPQPPRLNENDSDAADGEPEHG